MPSVLSHKVMMDRVSDLSPESRCLSRRQASNSRVTRSSMSADKLSAMSSIDMTGRPEKSSTIICKGQLVTESCTWS